MAAGQECRRPSHAILAEDFLCVFDGFSIGSNDLTQLILRLDRDSGTVAHLFDKRNEAVRWMIAWAIAAAKRLGKPIGICGQAPAGYPEFAAWLVGKGIDSISLNPDVALAPTVRVAAAEAMADVIQMIDTCSDEPPQSCASRSPRLATSRRKNDDVSCSCS